MDIHWPGMSRCDSVHDDRHPRPRRVHPPPARHQRVLHLSFGRIDSDENLRRFICVAGVSSWVADVALGLVVEDDRLVKIADMLYQETPVRVAFRESWCPIFRKYAW